MYSRQNFDKISNKVQDCEWNCITLITCTRGCVDYLTMWVQCSAVNPQECARYLTYMEGVNYMRCYFPHAHRSSFSEKHFNQSLSDAEREAIMKDSRNRTAMWCQHQSWMNKWKINSREKEKTPFWCRKISLQNSGPGSWRCWSTYMLVGRSTE